MEALLATYGGSSIDAAGAVASTSSTSAWSSCLPIALESTRMWAAEDYQKLKIFLELQHGGEDDDFDAAQESQTFVEFMGDYTVWNSSGGRRATEEEARQIRDKGEDDEKELQEARLADEDRFQRVRAAKAQEWDRAVLNAAMNEKPLSKRMRLEYEIKTKTGVSVGRGIQDVVEPTAQLVVSTTVAEIQEGPHGNDGVDEEEDDVESPQFDGGVREASQHVQPVDEVELIQVDGCLQEVLQANLALFVDGPATEELIEVIEVRKCCSGSWPNVAGNLQGMPVLDILQGWNVMKIID